MVFRSGVALWLPVGPRKRFFVQHKRPTNWAKQQCPDGVLTLESAVTLRFVNGEVKVDLPILVETRNQPRGVRESIRPSAPLRLVTLN